MICQRIKKIYLTKRTLVCTLRTNVRKGGAGLEECMMNEKKRENMKQILFLGVIFIIMLVTFWKSFSYNRHESDVKTETVSGVRREKIVTTVKVKKGSTLWDIAAEYCTEEYQDVGELVEEIKVSNGMKQNTIHEGAYLIVPYYVSGEQ